MAWSGDTRWAGLQLELMVLVRCNCGRGFSCGVVHTLLVMLMGEQAGLSASDHGPCSHHTQGGPYIATHGQLVCRTGQEVGCFT